MSAPAWLPDWRDATQYPDKLNTKATRWAWEFLRRNKEYQRLWNEIIVPYIKTDGTFDDEAAIETLERKKVSKIKSAFPKKSYQITSPAILFLERFQIGRLVAPSDASSTPSFNTAHVKMQSTVHLYKILERKAIIDIRNLYIHFRTDLPIAPQIKKAEKLLLQRVKWITKKYKIPNIQNVRYESSHYQNYLRILDATEYGVPPKEIAKVLYPLEPNDYESGERVTRKVRSALRTARKLSEADYTLIPLISSR